MKNSVCPAGTGGERIDCGLEDSWSGRSGMAHLGNRKKLT
jgi:hypothetical protein